MGSSTGTANDCSARAGAGYRLRRVRVDQKAAVTLCPASRNSGAIMTVVEPVVQPASTCSYKDPGILVRLQIEGMRSLVRGVPNAARRVDIVRSDQAVPYAKTIGNLGNQDMLSLSVVSASHGQCAISHLEIRARTFDLFGKEVGAPGKALLRDRQADRAGISVPACWAMLASLCVDTSSIA